MVGYSVVLRMVARFVILTFVPSLFSDLEKGVWFGDMSAEGALAL